MSSKEYKFSFRKVGDKCTEVKFNKQEVGRLFFKDDSWFLTLKINESEKNIMIYKVKESELFKYVILKKKFSSESEGREFINENSSLIYNLIADIYKKSSK